MDYSTLAHTMDFKENWVDDRARSILCNGSVNASTRTDNAEKQHSFCKQVSTNTYVLEHSVRAAKLSPVLFVENCSTKHP